MRFMIMVKADEQSEAGEMPSAELVAEMGKFNEDLVKAGVLLAAEGLHPSSRGVRVKFSGKDRTVVDGPFAETKELIAGFWLVDLKSMDDAIEWVRRVPNPMPGESEIEIRPVFEAEDFGELVGQVPEVFEAERKFREREDRLREARQRGLPAE